MREPPTPETPPESGPETKKPVWKNPYVLGFVIGIVFLTVLPFVQRKFLKAPPPIATLAPWVLPTVDGGTVVAVRRAAVGDGGEAGVEWPRDGNGLELAQPGKGEEGETGQHEHGHQPGAGGGVAGQRKPARSRLRRHRARPKSRPAAGTARIGPRRVARGRVTAARLAGER